MPKKFMHLTITSLLLLVLMSCEETKDDGKGVFQVGKTSISENSFKAFEKVKSYYPSYVQEPYFPGSKSNITVCVETEMLYQDLGKGKDKYTSSDDFQWKMRYYKAQMYLEDIVSINFMIPEKKLKKYYDDHKEEYKRTIKIKVNLHKDSTKTADDKPAERDSVSYRPFDAVKREIVQKIFLAENMPDEAFFKENVSASDSTVDTLAIKEKWYNSIRRNPGNFFMEKLYKESIGSAYVDSVDYLLGEDKIIKSKDLEVILGWIPEDRRQPIREDKAKQLNFVQWLVKWKLFSEKAESEGYLKSDQMKHVVSWAEKYEVVRNYVNGEFKDTFESSVTVDTTLVYYEYWDNNSQNAGVMPAAKDIESLITEVKNSKTAVKVDEEIYKLRQKYAVQFLSDDYVDDKKDDAATLVALADSLYNSGDNTGARKNFTKLVDNYLFTEQGLKALVELAKIQTEGSQHVQALKNYRKYLHLSNDSSKRCNIFFMIGFLYSEHISDPALAEVNYKWILKNEPTCELSDDAEFMALHLGEPMIDVDELQAEAKRQGRKIE